MVITITQEKKKQRYALLALAAIIFGILFVVWLGFSKKGGESEKLPQVLIASNVPQIDLDFLRKSLKVETLYLSSAELIADPISPISGQAIDLMVNISGLIGSTPLDYKFDCNDDEEYESTFKDIRGKTFTANDVCRYDKVGEYTAKVFIEGEFKYFVNEGERISKNSVRALSKIVVKEPNSDPMISLCDVSPIEGIAAPDFKFDFTVLADDSDKDNLSYLWDFGDGETRDIQNPSHQYRREGNYFPFVKVFDLTKEGKNKGGKASCYPSSLTLLKNQTIFEEIKPFEKEFGRKNPFSPY